MAIDVSEQWIGKVAGWKMLKAGRKLWKSGSVKSAEWRPEEGLFLGEVGAGEKPRRVRLLVNGEHDIDNKCACFMARRSGEICEHAVAVMLAAVLGKGETVNDWAPEPKVAATTPEFDAVALSVELPPNFPDRVENGLTIRFLQKEAEVSAFDLKLCAWFHKIGLNTVPGMLPVSGGAVDELMAALEGHPELMAGERQVSVVGTGVKLPVELELEGERIGLKLVTGVKYFKLANAIAAWDGDKYFLVARLGGRGVTESQIERLVNGGGMYFPVRHFVADFEKWDGVFDFGNADVLGQLRVIPASPSFILNLDGSLKKLSAMLVARYPGGVRVDVGVGSESANFPIQDRNNEGVWLSRNRAGESDAMRSLKRYGFFQDASGKWSLEGEEYVLDFLSGGLAELRKIWTVESGHKLGSIQNNVVRVKPDVKLEGSGQDWLAFDYGFQTDDGKPVPREAIEKMLKAGKRTATTKNGKRVIISEFDSEFMSEVLKDVDPRQEGGRYYVSAHQGAYLKRIREFYGKSLEMSSESCIERLPDVVRGLLRGYQREGIAWLFKRIKNESAALLADDMGLGKTLQTLSLLYLLKQENTNPALVVCPTSLLENWRAEAEKFFPEFKVEVMHGSERKEKFSKLTDADLVITSYGLLPRDLESYRKLCFSALVIDEASVIRNPDTQVAKALRKFDIDKRIALTGTPVENALQDLWSIFEYMMPKYLGSREEFRQRYVKPCSGSVPDYSVLKRLRLRVEPFMLRRTKQDVAKDLPAKIEQTVWCQPTAQQKAIYRSLHQKGVDQVQEAAKQGKGRAKMQMLTVLLRLRQACCDTRLLGDAGDSLEDASAKLSRLLELVDQAVMGGHRMLVFSQFTSMLALIKEGLENAGVSYAYLDGSTRNRGEVVRQFQKDDGPTVFLISLKAGGYGLNLTAADMVVHFDPWWNPAVEAQATDRAYRIGQTKPVNVFKLVTVGTVEEKILKLQEKKKSLIGATVDEDVMMTGLSGGDIESILEN